MTTNHSYTLITITYSGGDHA